MMTWCEGRRAVVVHQFGITLAAGPLLVASQTRNPLAVAMAAFLQRLPWLLFGLYAGVLADRLDRRAIVLATGLVQLTGQHQAGRTGAHDDDVGALRPRATNPGRWIRRRSTYRAEPVPSATGARRSTLPTAS